MIRIAPAQLAGVVFDLLLPPVCASCGETIGPDGPPVCGPCESRLPEIPRPWCPRCGYTRLPGLSSPDRCGECGSWPGQLRRSASAFLHESPAADLIHGLKYRGWTSLAARMGQLMVPAARRLTDGPALLVPVPLSPARLRERGYNQAGLLASALASELGWPCRPVLQRGRQGRRQVRSGRASRERNVQGAFRVARSFLAEARDDPGLTELPAVLVDDVITTGATVGECAAELEDSGLQCAGAVSFARTPPRIPGV
ncbi:MAG: ComF family protein [Gemmatimonadota bacterium]